MSFVKFILIFIIIPTFALAGDDNEIEEYRKHYGLSLNDGCSEYIKVFKCMSTCKSLSYKIYRLNFLCKCSCHQMRTTTIVPFFKWRTNGSTKAVPNTKSPGQYDAVGTLSPPTVEKTTTLSTSDPCAGRFSSLNVTDFGNKKDVGNSTDVTRGTSGGDAAQAANKEAASAATEAAAKPAGEAAAEPTTAPE